MNMKNTTLLTGIVLVVFLVSECSCGRSYVRGCKSIQSNHRQLIDCSSNRLIWIQLAWWSRMNVMCQSTHFSGGLNVTEKAATLCNGRSSCNITNKVSSVSFVTVYYYCKERNCKAIPLHATDNITCTSSRQHIAIEEAWVDIDVCIKSSEITVKNNITQQVRSLCDGQTFCSVPYIEGKHQYANVKYHCIDTGTTSINTYSTQLIPTTSYGLSTDINKELTHEPSTEQSTNIHSESITKVETTTRSIPIQKTEMHESVTGYYDTTSNYLPTDAETTQREGSTIEVGKTTSRQLQTTTVQMNSHGEDKTTIEQRGFSSETSTSPKYETTFRSDRTTNIEFTTRGKTMDSGGFTTEPTKITSAPGQLKTTIPSHSTSDLNIVTYDYSPDVEITMMASTETLKGIDTTSFINEHTSTENNLDTTRRYDTSSRIQKTTSGLGKSTQMTFTNYFRYISTIHYVKSSSKPKSTTWYKTEKYVNIPITRHYASKTTLSSSTQHNRVIGEKQSNKSFPLISIVAAACSVATVIIVVIMIVCFIKRRNVSNGNSTKRCAIEMHNPQYDIFYPPKGVNRPHEGETAFTRQEDEDEYSHLNHTLLKNKHVLFLEDEMNSGSRETSTDTYDHL